MRFTRALFPFAIVCVTLGCAGLYPSAEQRFGYIKIGCADTPTEERGRGDLVVMRGCGETVYLLEYACKSDGAHRCHHDVTVAVESFAFANACEVETVRGEVLGSYPRVALGLSGCNQRGTYRLISGSGWVQEGTAAETAAEAGAEQQRRDAADQAAVQSSQ